MSICPLCSHSLNIDEARAEFNDFPDVVMHADCIDDMGTDHAYAVCEAIYNAIGCDPHDQTKETEAMSDRKAIHWSSYRLPERVRQARWIVNNPFYYTDRDISRAEGIIAAHDEGVEAARHKMARDAGDNPARHNPDWK